MKCVYFVINLCVCVCLSCLAGSSNVASKHEELECLYAAVGKVIYEGLTNYEKATSANPTQLFGKPASHPSSSTSQIPPPVCQPPVTNGRP